MIKNYLKSALNSIWRRKWFSLLTLFSIALSLVVITCGATLWNMISAPLAPEIHKDRTFFLGGTAHLKKNGKEINYTNGSMVLTPNFFYKKVYQLETPQQISVFQRGGDMSFYKTGREKQIKVIRTDHNFFKVFDFEIIEGKPYSEKDNTATIPMCMVSKKFAEYYFETTDCISSILEFRNKQYKIAGIFKKPATTSITIADFYYQTNPDKDSKMWNWNEVAFLCHSKKDKEYLDAELQHIGQISSAKHEHQEIDLYSLSSVNKRLLNFIDKTLYPLLFALLLIILILPILCLIDILRNFIDMKREELGIRRAFGAKKKNIVLQLMVENLLITTLGGGFGLLFSFGFFLLLSDYNANELFFVFFDWRSFIYYLLVFITIGAIAGLLPSYRMSRQAIVSSLNNIEL